MMLSSLIKKGGLAGAMTATPATESLVTPVTVAPVATVAVADKLEPVPELLPEQELQIRALFAYIGETNRALMNDLIDQCRTQLPARCYLLKRAKEVPAISDFPQSIQCKDCTNFSRVDHPHLGHCAQSQPEAIAGLWDDDYRICDRFYRN